MRRGAPTWFGNVYTYIARVIEYFEKKIKKNSTKPIFDRN
jgi:hypothetical protein